MPCNSIASKYLMMIGGLISHFICWTLIQRDWSLSIGSRCYKTFISSALTVRLIKLECLSVSMAILPERLSLEWYFKNYIILGCILHYRGNIVRKNSLEIGKTNTVAYSVTEKNVFNVDTWDKCYKNFFIYYL